ncbi:hypothetical protein PC121_g25006 [Phytophthora cactorum]|nr:hypothetical protein PC121_g25006 [Phytophthora cactorum]
MEDSQLPLVRSAKDAHDAWSRLKGHFEKKSLANKLFLRRRFFTTMMDEGDGVLEHINKIKTLAEQLDAVGAPVSEDDLVITLLGSLSESYQFLITALESRADSLTWELVTSRLLHEDMKRKEQGGGVDGAAHGQEDKQRLSLLWGARTLDRQVSGADPRERGAAEAATSECRAE